MERMFGNPSYTHFVLHASAQGRPIYERLGFVNSSEWILPLA